MTDTPHAQHIMSQVESVLSAEKHLLLSGQVHRVAELAEEKVQAMEAFDSLLRDAGHLLRAENFQQRLKGIIQAAAENSIHFRAVQNGLQNIVSRLGRGLINRMACRRRSPKPPEIILRRLDG